MRAPTEAIKYMGKGARRRALTVQIYEAAAMPTQRLVDCCSPHEPERIKFRLGTSKQIGSSKLSYILNVALSRRK